MHLVIIAWLFVIFSMALTLQSALAGVALFATLGLGPVLLYVMIAMRRSRTRRERGHGGQRPL
jgi:hypothetical protein